jgi:hypothetical protein
MHLLDRLYWWLERETPYKCVCGHWVLHKKNARSAQLKWGVWVLVCPSCWEAEHKWNKENTNVPSS